MAIRFHEVGFKIIGLDIDRKKIEKINDNKSFINHIDSKKIEKLNDEKSYFTDDFKFVKDADAVIICVPTPLKNSSLEPDLSYIETTLFRIKPYLRKNQIIILESTVYPGTLG